jgi:hypothetical protein
LEHLWVCGLVCCLEGHLTYVCLWISYKPLPLAICDDVYGRICFIWFMCEYYLK